MRCFLNRACFAFLMTGSIYLGTVSAGAQPGDVQVVCEGNQNFVLSPHAITLDGEIVTGYILSGPGRTQHVRLIPMGNGYRYSGIGIWLDGVRDTATMSFGPDRLISCKVNSGLTAQ